MLHLYTHYILFKAIVFLLSLLTIKKKTMEFTTACMKSCVKANAVTQLIATHRPEATPRAAVGRISDISSHVIGPQPIA